jgi:hypothetical protein
LWVVRSGKGAGAKAPHFLALLFPGLKPGASSGRCFASIQPFSLTFRSANFGRDDNLLGVTSGLHVVEGVEGFFF